MRRSPDDSGVRLAKGLGWVGAGLGLAALGWALGSRRDRTGRAAVALAAVAGVTALEYYVSRKIERSAAARPVTATITVNRRPGEVYAFWRNLDQLPRFMENLESVQMIDDRRSHWTAKSPTGVSLAWDAEIVADVVGERIAWRTLEEADIGHRGQVTFRAAPGGRRTEVRVEMSFGEAGGSFGRALAKIFAGPQIAADLHRFKQVMETGGVVHSDASLHRGMHPARPSMAKGELAS